MRDALPPVVALSGAAGAGKSTAADHLINAYGYQRLKFAGPLKSMLRAIGLTDAHIEGDLKEIPCDLLGGATPRRAMIALGTEWGRDLIHPDLWAMLWRGQAEAIIAAGGRVVVDDCRYLNEASAAKSLGGVIFRIERRDNPTPAINHESEKQPIVPDLLVYNDLSTSDLYRTIDSLLSRRPCRSRHIRHE